MSCAVPSRDVPARFTRASAGLQRRDVFGGTDLPLPHSFVRKKILSGRGRHPGGTESPSRPKSGGARDQARVEAGRTAGRSSARALSPGSGNSRIFKRPLGETPLPKKTKGLPKKTEPRLIGERGLPKKTRPLPKKTRGLPKKTEPRPIGERGLPKKTRPLPKKTRGLPKKTEASPKGTRGLPKRPGGCRKTRRPPPKPPGEEIHLPLTFLLQDTIRADRSAGFQIQRRVRRGRSRISICSLLPCRVEDDW